MPGNRADSKPGLTASSAFRAVDACRSNGLAPTAEFGVLAHEYAHNCFTGRRIAPDCLDTRELEAEAVAFVVSHAVGLNAIDRYGFGERWHLDFDDANFAKRRLRSI